ncbi:MAG TPA: UDP-N-acetylglucosamine 2-epimerase (non-hydrolyzing) [Gemmatimonadaceae bacterium]|nr:UDP-N-acetylglucosamine 2-epimerase (non-hydrolyzing) [Gemmatimonadaceae bacterium]
MKLLHVVGARPNFPKLSPVFRAAAERGFAQVVVHTGQHYDPGLSAVFFEEFGLPAPDFTLEVGSGSHAQQTARALERIEPVLVSEKPDWTILYGDVNSTLAAALAAAKLRLPTAHVEAGVRSWNRAMPEEINRIVTDRVTDLLLAPSEEACATLRREGEADTRIKFVGNVMVDCLRQMEPAWSASRMARSPRTVLVTLHRPSNVDDTARLQAICDQLAAVATDFEVLFPVHPRTKARFSGQVRAPKSVALTEPMSYVQMLGTMASAHCVITDSGGVQVESTVLNTPCFTLRDETEWQVTLSEGTNTLVKELGELPSLVRRAVRRQEGHVIAGWDGRASRRVMDALE